LSLPFVGCAAATAFPTTLARLGNRTLVPNVALRNAIEEYFDGHSSVADADRIKFAEIEFEREIGAGSAKTVFEARWKGKQVAALKMKAGSCDTEIGVLTRLSKHPSLIRFFGVASDGAGFDYMVTELAPKGSLCDVLERFDETASATICFGVMMAVAHQICEGMEAVACEGLIHRDLACRNVLCFALDSADPSLTDVKVCDFGLSRAGSTFYGGDNNVPIRWMPPEALQRRRWSEKSDVWAFGVTLWELFNYGCIPFAELVADADVCKSVLDGR
jgi:serine/threonine protein kinase